MEPTTLKWRRVRAGLYESQLGGDRYEVEEVTADLSAADRRPGERRRWLCRRNGEAFEAAETLTEAKHWCDVSTEFAAYNSSVGAGTNEPTNRGRR
jgi:hypothetical protein